MRPRATGPSPVPRHRQRAKRPEPPNYKQPESKLAWSPSFPSVGKTSYAPGLADGFDFHEQILEAYVGLQVQDMRGGTQCLRQCGLDGGEIGRSSHVYLELEFCHREAGRANDAIRFIQQRADVDHGLARLRDDIAAMNGFVADDAGRTGNEQLAAGRFAPHAGPRKNRPVSAEFGWIVISAGLPGVLDHFRRPPGRQKIDGYRAAGRRA